MTLWIKICGMTTPEAVEAAVDAGVDAIGFVFAESVRQLSPARAATLAAPARGRVLCAAVTRHPTQRAIDEIMEIFKPDLLQTDVEDLPGIHVPRQLPLLPVFRQRPPEEQRLPVRLLFEGLVSGSGVPGDWATARRIAGQSELILAGGLNATNVAAAIEEVRPFGVDVSSGVEERRGVKSPAAIARFVSAARVAGRSKDASHATHGYSARNTPDRR
jgi:phosphoribosylanthranilate isomerase